MIEGIQEFYLLLVIVFIAGALSALLAAWIALLVISSWKASRLLAIRYLSWRYRRSGPRPAKF